MAVANKVEHKQLRKDVQMVFQSPYASLNPRQKVGDQLAEPLLITIAMSTSKRRQKLQAILKRDGMPPEHYLRYPHMFTGGQIQRCAYSTVFCRVKKTARATGQRSIIGNRNQQMIERRH